MLRRLFTVLGACLALTLPGAAGPLPIPSSAVGAANMGEPIYASKCVYCHTLDSSSAIFTGEDPYFFAQVLSNPSAYNPTMVADIKALSAEQKDDLAVFLASKDTYVYTLKGQAIRTNPAAGVANATITMQTDYLTGKGLFFENQTVQTDAQGYYSIQSWPGRKILTINRPGITFLPSVISDIEFTADGAQWGTYTQVGTSDSITTRSVPGSSTFSGMNFLSPLITWIKYPLVSPNIPWVVNATLP